MKKIAVVILNWNGEKLLREFLPSIIKFSDEATVYVADNASTDQSIEVIQNEFPSIKIIQNTENFGFAKGYNYALKEIEEPYYALVNSDIEVTENWLQPILSTFDNDYTVAIIQPKILAYNNKECFEYAGAAGGFIDKYGYPFCRGRIFESIEKDNNQYNDTTEIFWASGACFFIRKEVFKKLNGFDEDFFAHQEEIDLCWRAFNEGYKTIYNHKSLVYHVGGATLNVGSPQKTFLNFRNSLWMLTKNLPKNKLLPILFLRLCFDGIASFRFLFQGNFKHILSILKAHFYFYTCLFYFLKKRNDVQNKNYFKTKSIIVQYFIKKRVIFNEII
ncbi:glycosyltransferase family 2 protein [Flavobacterium sp.]|jgi:GT2 family glycosyltransferase|uniref:glycosyltransferase family 2 protein n=1 Tax=Flavobacterium sp. TaxID=239 RepID=UPI002A7EDAB6|nr:glycosyltransferase family 2 protein [Flavobacterium sp.]